MPMVSHFVLGLCEIRNTSPYEKDCFNDATHSVKIKRGEFGLCEQHRKDGVRLTEFNETMRNMDL